MKKPQTAVRISSQLEARARVEFCEKTGLPMTYVLDDAMKYWLDNVMPGRLKALVGGKA